MGRGFPLPNRLYGVQGIKRRELPSGIGVEPRPETDFSALQASQNMLLVEMSVVN